MFTLSLLLYVLKSKSLCIICGAENLMWPILLFFIGSHVF